MLIYDNPTTLGYDTTNPGGLEFQGLNWLGGSGWRVKLAQNPLVGSELVFQSRYTVPGWTDRVLFSSNGNVGIGTTNPGSYKLAVEGTIGARDVMVTNAPWSDYVFRPGYQLRPLSEVSAFIQKHHHLPEIPTEAEVKEKGVSLGDMQAKLLAKVEELTLHMIQADERNNRLEKQNRELRERIAKLEAGSAR